MVELRGNDGEGKINVCVLNSAWATCQGVAQSSTSTPIHIIILVIDCRKRGVWRPELIAGAARWLAYVSTVARLADPGICARGSASSDTELLQN